MLDATRLKFENFEDFRHCLRGADFEVVPLSTTPFRGRSTIAALGDVIFSTGHFSGDIRSRGMLHSDGVQFGFTLGGPTWSRTIQWGIDAQPGQIFVTPHDVEQDGCARGDNRFATLTVKPETLERMGVFEALSVPDRTWTRRQVFGRSPAISASLDQSIRAFATKITQSDFDGSNTDLAALGRSVLITVLAGIEVGNETSVGQSGDTGIGIVRKVENWMDSRDVASIDVLSLCQGVGVSLRTLQRAFQKTLQMGPSQYLALRRLAAARAALLSGCDRGRGIVSDVALAHGFSELGRFAGFYRRYYGETPRQTLARRHRGS